MLWLAPGVDQWRLAAVLGALGAGAGALAGAAAASADALLARRVRSASMRHAVLVAPAMTVIAWLLFTGGSMRRLPMLGVLRPLAAAALTLVAAASFTALRALVRTLRERSRGPRDGAALAFVAAAQALHAVDHRAYPRLYEYLHAALGALTLLGFAAAVDLFRRRTRTRRAEALAVLAVGLGVAAPFGLDAWPNVRAEVFGVHAPFVRHVARAVAWLRPPASRVRWSPQREAVPAAARAGLPRWAGAHVLLITVDAMRADRLGRIVDGRSLTPTLDALGARGVVFARAYTQAPHSSYSLSSLHTGEYLHETVPLGQPQPLATLAGTFARRGYATAAVFTRGIFFTEGERLTAYRDADFGFARADHVDRGAEGQGDAIEQELDEVVRRGEPPSFAWVHFFDAHAPYQGRGDTPEQQYDAAVRHVDAVIGRVLEHARRVLRRPLIVAVSADHGEEFGEHGGVYHGSSLYEEQARVPLVIAAPGIAPGVVTEPVQLVDVAPTLLGMAGVAPPPSMRGEDLRPWMPGRPPGPARTVYAAVNTRAMAFRTPYKFIADLTYGVEELYDVVQDPAERRNLAGADVATRDALHAALEGWLGALAEQAGDGAALARGRLGDRAVAPDLLRLAVDRARLPAARAEAVTLLARFADAAMVGEIRPLLDDASADVRAEAVIALGRAGYARARAMLPELLNVDPPERRWRAALALGDGRAVDALAEALWSADEVTALDAARTLGTTHDPRAFEVLVARMPDDHLRYRVVLALGASRDARALALLTAALGDATDDVRANAVAALGMLGDLRAIPWILARPQERYAAEALGALGAVGRDVPGWDARGQAADGARWERCDVHDDTLGWRLLRASSCVSPRPAMDLTLPRDGALRLVVRARREGGAGAAPVAVLVDGREVGRLTVFAGWIESRLDVAAVGAGSHRIELVPDAADVRVRVDHVVAFPDR